MGKNQQYANQYAEYAMEQMRRYGIPASVTLAQGILESSNGQSALARNENNHFGIKATPDWIAGGGTYGIYTDDRPNEKFCSYASVGDSYEHHSKFLIENSRYAACFALPADDYKGWTQGLEKAGYATGGNYAATLQRIIEQNDLQRYDRMVMQQMQTEGRTFGADADTLGTSAAESDYSFPVERDEFLFITSPFGMRQDPMDATRQQMHKGIDIRCKGDAVLATENGGKVVAVNGNANTAGGMSVTVEYNRKDGGKMQCTYMHLSHVEVAVGDTLRAGERLGISGNTGTRTTGEHLHFGVVSIYADGTKRDIDPAAYLADIAQKGNIKVQAMYNGTDLLAKYKGAEAVTAAAEKPLAPDDWMKKLLSSEDSGVGISGCNDPIIEMAMTAFASLMMLAVQIDNRREEEQMAAISEAADRRRIDLAQLVPGMKSCALVLEENGKAVLHADNGAVQVSRVLTSAELSRLSVTLGSETLTEESKRMRVAGMVNAIVLSEVASQNFEQEMNRQQGQSENLRR